MENMTQPVNSIQEVHCHTLLSLPWKTMLCDMTWWWIQYSISLWVIVLPHVLYAKMRNLHPKCNCLCHDDSNLILSRMVLRWRFMWYFSIHSKIKKPMTNKYIIVFFFYSSDRFSSYFSPYSNQWLADQSTYSLELDSLETLLANSSILSSLHIPDVTLHTTIIDFSLPILFSVSPFSALPSNIFLKQNTNM